MSRRGLLRGLGVGAAVVGLAACGVSTGTVSEIPDETAGPYPADGSNGPDVLTKSGIVRRDIRSSFGGATGVAAGIPLTITLSLKDLAQGGSAFSGAAVYVWHADRSGRYSLYSSGITGQNYLRGVQVANSVGVVTFTSIYPACYDGRWPHIHFEVYPNLASITDSTKAISTSQMAMPKDVSSTVYATAGYEASKSNLAKVSLQTDNVFRDDSGAKQLPNISGSVSTGYAASLVVGVDTRTTPVRR